MSCTMYWVSAIGKETAERIILFPSPPFAVIIFATEFVTGLSTGYFFKIDWIFLEYRKRKKLNKVNLQILQCLDKRLFPGCVNMRWKLHSRHHQQAGKGKFSPQFMQIGESFQAKPCWMCVEAHLALSKDVAFPFLWSVHDASIPLLGGNLKISINIVLMCK